MDREENDVGTWEIVRRLCLWSGVLGGFVALMSLVVLPLVADAAVHWLPRSFESSLSSQVERKLVSNLITSGQMPDGAWICQSPTGVAALAKVFKGFSGAIPPDAQIRVVVLEADIANALALPGDRLIIFSKLFELTDHPNAFAGVMAHELGHLIARDPLRGLVERSYGSMLLSLLVGEKVTGAMNSGVSKQVLFAANTLEMEHNADNTALELMRHAGLDSTAVAGFFANLIQHFGKQPEQLSLFQTHPTTKDRIDFFLNSPKTGSNIALTDDEWSALRNICSVKGPYVPPALPDT